MLATSAAAARPAVLPLFAAAPAPDRVSGLFHAATELARLLGQGRALDSRALRAAMEAAFGASDASGAWAWKDSYEAAEAAQVLFLRKFGRAMRTRAGSPTAMLEMLNRLGERLPSQTRRSEESNRFQQFSTPIALGLAAAEAAAMTPDDLVLEPSAGTGLLAIFAELAGAGLALNEIADTRAGLLARLYRDCAVTRHNAEHIHDLLDPAVRPSVVLMNPPFSSSPHVEKRFAEAAFRHLASAFARLREGGRLVAITGHNVGSRGTRLARGVRAAAGTGRARRVQHGDRGPGLCPPRHDDGYAAHSHRPGAGGGPAALSAVAGQGRDCRRIARSGHPPGAAAPGARSPLSPPPCFHWHGSRRSRGPPPRSAPAPLLPRVAPAPSAVELAYETCAWAPAERGRLTAALYEGYALQTLRIAGAQPHPTKLVQSAAMAAVAPPRPSYKPLLPSRLVEGGLLSDAQLESIVYAGEAHSGHLAGSYTVDETWDQVAAAPEGAAGAVRFRRGWFLGDGTGAGKGRQVAAIILDNWLRPAPAKAGGRRRALWISKSDKLIEDAERDWTALGGYRSDLVPLSRFKQGAAITLAEGILFTTYATLRTQARAEKQRAAYSRSSTGSAPGSTASSCSTKRMRWPMPPATKENAARRNPRSRARRDCGCSTHCPRRASSMSRRPVRRRCRTSPTPPGSASGAPAIFRSRPAPSSSPRWKAAASPRWRCWRAI